MGDLVVADYTYELWRPELNAGFGMGFVYDNIVSKITGLLGLASLKSTKKSRQGRHGSRFPQQLFNDRVVQFDLNLGAASQSALETKLEDVGAFFAPSDTDLTFVYQRPGRGKRLLYVRPTRAEFDSTSKVALLSAPGSVELTAGDPLYYAFAATASAGNIAAASATTGNITVTNAGKFDTERMVITLTGTANGPVIQNSTDGNKQIKFTGLVMGAADVLVVDIYNRTVTLNGADARSYIANDSQWWKVLRGANTVVVTRTGTTGTLAVAMSHRNAWPN